MKSYIAISALAAVVAAQTNGTATNSTGSGPVGAARSCKDSRAMCQSGTPGSCDAAYTKCAAACEAAYNTARVAPNANQAQSVADYATCLGQLPAFINGGNGAGAGAGAGANNGATTTAVVTKVVNSYVTYCPAATSFYNNGQLYVATGATTITVTNCPCTVTSTLGSVPSPTGPSVATGTGGIVTSTVAKNTTVPVTPYKGAAASGKFVAGGLSAIAAVAGVLAFAL